MCAALLRVSSCRRRKTERRQSRSQLQDHHHLQEIKIRWLWQCPNVAGRSAPTLLCGFRNSPPPTPRTATPQLAPLLLPRPPRSHASVPFSSGLCASIRDVHLAAVTCAQRRSLHLASKSSTFVAEVDLFCRALASGRPPTLHSASDVHAKSTVSCSHGQTCPAWWQGTQLCAGKLRMRQGARAASWCWCWEGGAVAIGDGLHFLLVQQ